MLNPSARQDSEPINIFLASGSPLVLETVVEALRGFGEVRLVGTATLDEDLLGRISRAEVEVVLVEANEDARAALEVTRRIRDAFPEVEILLLGVGDPEEVVLFAEAGASGYLGSDGRIAELLRTIQEVYRKRTPCSHEVASFVVSRICELAGKTGPGRPVVNGRLSGREIEIVEHAARGLSNQEIAHRLQISLSTVKNHVHRILRKLDVRSRREAIASVFRLGLIDDPLSRSRVSKPAPARRRA